MDTSSADDDATSVRVAVRVRPLIGREKVERCDECVSVVEEDKQIVMGKNRSFAYDYVYSTYAQQSDIWPCVDPLVTAAFDGYNATIFAYGQTGSGKTFTMGSGSSVNLSSEDFGIIPRVISYMFEHIEALTAEQPQYKAEVHIRFLEVYGEEIRDLLVQLVSDAGSGDCRVTLRETEKGEVQVVGALEEVVGDADQCMRLLERGTLCRTTGSTLMNAHSSRSHAIFTVSMVQHIPIKTDADEPNAEVECETRSSYFNFVDLAGSERQKRTQAEGKRLKEGIDINKGLLALGNVISALGDDTKRGRVHVPYRDSKLTRMLQDSLGGNSRTLMLCCVSPADVNFEETLNALKYANRARNIKNKPIVNRDEGSAMNSLLRRQVEELQAEVFRLRNPGLTDAELKSAFINTNAIGTGTDYDSFGNLRARAETAENEVERLTSELKRNRAQLDHFKEEMIAAQAERDFLRLCAEDGTATAGGSGVDGNGEAGSGEHERISGVFQEHLRTIADLEEKLRTVERERDRALLNNNLKAAMGFDAPLLSDRPSAASSAESNVKTDFAVRMDPDLLERAERELQEESEHLRKLQSDAEMTDDGADDSAEVDEGEGEDEEMEESSESSAMSVEQSQENAERQQVYERRQKQYGDNVQNLADNIAMKEQLVRNLRIAQESMARMKESYDQKMHQMAEEVRMAQLDRERLIEEIQQIELKAKTGGDSGGRLSKLSNDLKIKESELTSLKKRQNEMNRYVNLHKKNETQLRVLQAEISNMKRQKVDLLRKMQEERKRYQEEANSRLRELRSVKRSEQREKQKVRQLVSKGEANERVLKRKVEENAALKVRLRKQEQLQMESRRKAQYDRTSRGRGNDAKWLSDEVRHRAEEQRKLEQLRKEHADVKKEMEALYAQRDKLETELQNSIPATGSIRDVLISPMKTPLNRRLSRGDPGARQLAPEEEQVLFDLEERIESCQAQLEYKEEKISEISDVDDTMPKIESTQSLPEARTLLKMLFGMAVDVRKQEQLKEQELTKMEVEVSEMARLLEQERERAHQIKASYEESLQRVMGSGSGDATSAVIGTPLNERTRILLSAAEERNLALRQKCDELESMRDHIDRERQLVHQKLMAEQHNATICRDRIRYLESQLSAAKGRSNTSPSPSQFVHHPFQSSGSVPPAVATGPVSWANDFDEDDEGEDEEIAEHHRNYTQGHVDEDVDMNDDYGQSHGNRTPTVFGKPPSSSSRRGFITTTRGEASRNDEVEHERDHTMSDDSASTSNSSIFMRLANPSNFTGIHKNRAKESASKRDILQSKLDKNRSRRQRDRGPASTRVSRPLTPTVERAASGRGLIRPTATRASPVMQVLENMKLEHGSADQRPKSPVPRPRSPAMRPPQQVVDASGGSMPPPAPQLDVYSRLSARTTASWQGKSRQSNVPPSTARHPKHEDNGKSITSDTHSIDDEATAMSMDEAEDLPDYDPLLGTRSDDLIMRVHEDYQQRLNSRNAE